MQLRWKPVLSGLIVMGVVVLLANGLIGRAQNRSGSIRARYVMLEREAVILQPAQIAATNVRFADWSPDGRHVVAFRTDAGNSRPDAQLQERADASEISIELWNAALGRSFRAWKHSGVPTSGDQSSEMSWLVGSQTAALPLTWSETTIQTDATGGQKNVEVPHQVLLLIDTLREQVRELPLAPNAEIQASPTKPQFLVHDISEHTVRVLDPTGASSPVFALPKTDNLNMRWMPDGSAILLTWFEKVAGTPKGGMYLYARMDLATGEVTRLDKAPQRPVGIKALSITGYAGPLRIRQTTQTLRSGDAAHRTHPLWLESNVKSEQMQTLLCADGASGQISPRGNAALFLSQGAAWVAPLAHAPRDVFTQSLRAVAMSNAKQAGLAIVMYCQDYDEMLPGASDHLIDSIFPYVKNEDILEGLNYTYGGGALGDLKDPKSTVLGSYGAPGGMVIIYADGHVVWKDK